MRKQRYYILPNKYFSSLFFLLFLNLSMGNAANHVIKFGGTLGNNYSPSELAVEVGDTVTWQGTFSSHPLSSTSIPQSAMSFHNGTGTSFSYIVQVAGTYNYECDFHGSSGMTGSLTATVSSVEENGLSALPERFRLDQNFPNPFNPITTIRYHLPISGEVELSVYNLLGQKIETLVSERKPTGQHQVQWDASQNASGIYYYIIKVDEYQDVKMMVLEK